MKIRSVEAELFHADGQTDMTKLIVAFRNFANAPKKPPLHRPPLHTPVPFCGNNSINPSPFTRRPGHDEYIVGYFATNTMKR